MRLPLLPEWAPQAATLLCWPHEGTDWAPRLQAIRQEYILFIRNIARFQPVIVLVADPASRETLSRMLSGTRPPHPVYGLELPFSDTWVRDFGPLTLSDGKHTTLLSLRFDGWGGKYPADANDAVCRGLQASGLFADTPFHFSELTGEGGNLESDGQWLLASRHSFACRSQRADSAETLLQQELGLEKVFWLDCPPLPGDDTDGHIDTLARFSEDGGIVWQPPANPEDSQKLETQLQAWHGPLHRLPPLPEIVDEGQPLPASYANFLIVNDAILVPAYGVPADQAATEVISRAFPERQILSQPARQLIWQYGSLHCASMQIPAVVPIRFERLSRC